MNRSAELQFGAGQSPTALRADLEIGAPIVWFMACEQVRQEQGAFQAAGATGFLARRTTQRSHSLWGLKAPRTGRLGSLPYGTVYGETAVPPALAARFPARLSSDSAPASFPLRVSEADLTALSEKLRSLRRNLRTGVAASAERRFLCSGTWRRSTEAPLWGFEIASEKLRLPGSLAPGWPSVDTPHKLPLRQQHSDENDSG